MFTGETILSDITPHPSLAYFFQVNRHILPEWYQEENMVYELLTYIRSLNKIASLTSQPFGATFRPHRLFYNGKFSSIHSSSDRAMEIIQFHIDRCCDILRIMDRKPTSIKDIAIQHFAPELLVGVGEAIARDEVMAHLEVMEECGDVWWLSEDRNVVQYAGSNNFLGVIGQYIH
jgi:hypothetical protein